MRASGDIFRSRAMNDATDKPPAGPQVLCGLAALTISVENDQIRLHDTELNVEPPWFVAMPEGIKQED